MNTFVRNLAISTSAILLVATTAHAQTAAKPVLKVITPAEGQTIYGTRIPILVAVENMELVDPVANTKAVAGQGHVNLNLDEAKPTAESAVKMNKDTFTYTDVEYGEHTLRAELVGNNNASLNPPVVVTVKFKSAALASPSPAAASGFDKNMAIVILVVVALVIVAAWWYTKEEDEEEEAISSKKKATSSKTKKKRRK